MRCSFCTKHWIQTHTFTSAVTTCKFNVPILDSFFSGIYKTSFICQLCQETNIFYEPIHHITVQPNTDIFSYLAKDFRENKNLTCRKCTIQSSQSLRTSYQETPNITSDKVTSGTIVMISTKSLQKLIYSRCRIMFILCFMPKRSI